MPFAFGYLVQRCWPAVALLCALTANPLAAATLTLTKTAPATVATGEVFDFQLSYTCTAVTQGENCTGAYIQDVLPANIEVVSCVGSAAHQQLPTGVSCSTGLNRTVRFYFSQSPQPANVAGTLPAGSTGTVTIRAKFTQGSTPNGTLRDNTANFYASNATTVSSTASVTAVAADLATVTKARLSSNSVKGEPTLYRVRFCQPGGSAIGGLNATGLTLTERIPTGASYVDGSANNGGVFVAGSGGAPDTVVWSGLTRNVTTSTSESCTINSFQVLYPADFPDSTVTNVIAATYTPAGEPQKTLEASVTHGFVTGTTNRTWQKSNAGTSSNTYPINTLPGFEWRSYVSNTGSVTLRNVVITDPIPKQTRVTEISIGGFVPRTSIRAQYRLEATGDTWYDLPGNPYTAPTVVPVANLNPIPTDDNQITAVRWLYGDIPSGFQYDTNTTTNYNRVRVIFQDPDRDGGAVAVGTAVVNTATLTADNLTTTNANNTVTTSAGLPLLPRVDKSPDLNSTPYPQLPPGGQQTFALTLTNASATSGPDLYNPVLLDTLPATLEYVSHTVSYGTGITPPASGDAPVFSQYANPTGNSGTVLRWAWPNLLIPQSRVLTVSLVVKARRGVAAPPGTYINLAMLSGLGSASVPGSSTWAFSSCRVNNPAPVDTSDLDQDGNTSEYLCQSRNAPVVILPSAALNSVKEVRGGCAGAGSYASNTTSYGNGPVDYRLTVSNPGNLAVRQAVFYDIFPWVGDRGVISSDSRGSEWAPVLTGAVAVPAGASVAYSASTNPCRPELFGGTAGQTIPSGCSNDWTTTAPTDITTVKALRVDFGTNLISPDDALRFSWPMRAPVSAALTDEGNNSFGYIATRNDGGTPALQAAEPNLVVTTIECVEQPPFIGDRVWLDADGDGIQDAGEAGINGVVVALYDPGPDENPGGGDDSLVTTTLTAPDGAGNDGFYRFGDLVEGRYYVRFTAPPGYSISPPIQGTDSALDSDADQETGIAPALSVISGDQRIDIDLGLFPATTASVGNYLWIDRNADGLQNESPGDGLNGVPVRLLGDQGQPVATTLTADDSFGNPGYYLFTGVAPGSYSIEIDRSGTFATSFSEADQGGGTADSRIVTDTDGVGLTPQFSVSAGNVVLNQDAGLIFPTGTLAVGDRIWLDTNNNGRFEPEDETGLDDVLVMLYQDTDANGVYSPGTDREVGGMTSFTKAGVPGFYEFTGLPAGDYLLVFPPANFAPGGPLAGLVPSGDGVTAAPDPDNDVDDDLDQNAWTGATGTLITRAITLSAGDEPGGDTNLTLDAGFVALTTLNAIGNRVWMDDGAGGGIANNGKRDGTEAGVDGVLVGLYDGNGALVSTTTTADGGLYWFDRLLNGTWRVRLAASNFASGAVLGGLVSSTGAGADQISDEGQDENGVDNNRPAVNGIWSNLFTLAADTAPVGEAEDGYDGALADASVNATADFGLVVAASPYVGLGNLVFIDNNDNGRYEPGSGETPAVGITVGLYRDGADPTVTAPLRTTTTAADGSYWFDGLDPGRYFVHLAPRVFQTAPLIAHRAASTAGGDTSADDDMDQNGLIGKQPLTHGVRSGVVDLAAGAEPVGEAGAALDSYTGDLPDGNVNATIDLGLHRPPGTLTCREICDVNSSGTVTNTDISIILTRRNSRVTPSGAAASGDCLPDGVITSDDAAACRAFR